MFGVIVLPITIAAIVCGHLARRKISRPDSQFGGGSLAMAGLVTGYLGLASIIMVAALWGGIMLFLPEPVPPVILDTTSLPTSAPAAGFNLPSQPDAAE